MYIECKNVGKRLKRENVLRDINICLESGSIYGLWGKNGCGKTMLMRALCGLLHPIEGEILIDGEHLGGKMEFPPSVGVMIERPSFMKGYTGYENLKLIASLKKVVTQEEIKNAMLRVGLDPEDKRKYYKYSLGMQQRLGIACAIMEKPELVLLDEPVNALDEEGLLLVRDILREEKKRGALVVIACHDREEMQQLADHVFVMDNGTVTEECFDKKI